MFLANYLPDHTLRASDGWVCRLAGFWDTVLINRDGNAAPQLLKNPDACVISVIVGIVDSVYLEQ